MNSVLFISAECAPFARTGGLADVCMALPKEFSADKWDVRVVIPCFSGIQDELKKQCSKIAEVEVSCGSLICREKVMVFRTIFSGLVCYLLENGRYFDSKEPYSSNLRQDIEKYIFFDRAVLEMLPVIGFAPDLLHCHDWPAAMVPVFLKELYQKNAFYQKMKTIMTVHNLKFQGIWDIPTFRSLTGLPDYVFSDGRMIVRGSGNMLKGGLSYADYITTVSPTYCNEIQTETFGEGMNDLLARRHLDMQGILNGIDYELYSPEKDPFLPEHYSAADFKEKKRKNKEELQKLLGLNVDGSVFMIGVASRLIDLKGTDLVISCMSGLIDNFTQIVIAGTGNPNYEATFREWAWRYPSQISANIYEEEELMHQIYGACDAILIPSAYTPCGISQMLAFRYGTVPIVHETGGLKDTVCAFNEYADTGDGFSFAKKNPDDLLHVVNYAKQIYFDRRNLWDHIAARGMGKDYSWHRAMLQYEQLYHFLLNNGNNSAM